MKKIVCLDEVSLEAGDPSVERMLCALATCAVGHVTLTREYLKNDWPLLELWILGARWELEAGWKDRLIVDLYEGPDRAYISGKWVNELKQWQHLLPWNVNNPPTMVPHTMGSEMEGSDVGRARMVIGPLLKERLASV